jgi:predicted transcriptional regulator
VNEIAHEAGISQSAAVTHIQTLERAGLITTRSAPAKKGAQKVCSSRLESAVVLFGPLAEQPDRSHVVVEMPVGLFFEHEVHPTCGMCSEDGLIGFQDSASTFLDPHRAAAQLLWFERGYVEYRLPVRREHATLARSVAVSVELCSEFPGHRAEWPSDITVWMNGVDVGTFRSPGDPGDRRGHLNPGWWGDNATQYGFLKEWRVTGSGSFVDGVRVSDAALADLRLAETPELTVRFGIRDDAEYRGGINIFGSRFGNYPQDIRMTIELGG